MMKMKKCVLFNNVYANSLEYLSQDLYGDSQWQKLNSPLAGSHLKSKEIIISCSYIVINVHDKENHRNIYYFYSTLTMLHPTAVECQQIQCRLNVM